MQIFEIAAEDSGKRIDLFLKDHLKEYSRSQIQRFINEKMVSINDTPITNHHRVRSGEKICVELTGFRALQKISPEPIPLNIIYEDEDLIIVEKPVGMISHPAGRIYSGTLINALLYHWQGFADFENTTRPGLVHRLDKDTSGIMIVAKNEIALLRLAGQFAARTVKRVYIAVVCGSVELDEGIIDEAIGRHPGNRKKMAVGVTLNSKEAQTYYKVLKRTDVYTVLEIHPITGRTHQIRVHMAFIGHPLLGDNQYGRMVTTGALGLSRQALHAAKIAFDHPRTAQRVSFECPLPQDIQEFFTQKYDPHEKPPKK